MKKSIIFLMIFVFLVSFLYAGENYFIQGIVFKGIKNVPYNTVQSNFGIKVFTSVSEDEINREISRLKESRLFMSVGYTLQKVDGGYNLIVLVEEYPVISQIKFPDAKLVPLQEIKEKIYSTEGKFFIEDKIKKDCENIKEIYRKKGFVLIQDPTFSFENNMLTFYWLETPPISRIEIKANNDWEKKVIEEYLDLSVGDYLNLTKIENANKKLEKKDLKLQIIPNWELEDNSLVLYLSLKYLPPREISLEYKSNEYLSSSFNYFSSPWGNFGVNIKYTGGVVDYALSWRNENLRVEVGDKLLSLSYDKDLSRDFTGEVGIKWEPQSWDNALFFNIKRDTLVEENGIYKNGSLLGINLDFHGGGSPYNYSLITLSGKYFNSYGEDINERIIGLMGEFVYPIGISIEGGKLLLKAAYSFPIGDKNYLSLELGGESIFRPEEVKAISDISFKGYGGAMISLFYDPWRYNFGLDTNFSDIVKFYLSSEINF
ncbi:MAG TPA: hypothetical protein PL130_07015 [Dictyoglomaceae bacterium]|nr:hypothetical protein [Dictyoglomaceae bacterium]HPU43187.1 hypothetical protein [Dictyoglomaceae bacterium]